MNRQINYDAEFCGKVPLNQTNLIQPHGVLLVIDKADNRVLQASENVAQVFGLPARDFVSQNLDQLLTSTDFEHLQAVLSSNTTGKLPILLQVQEQRFLATVYQQPEVYFLEIDIRPQASTTDHSFVSVYQQVKYMMATIDAAASTEETCRVAAAQLKKFSGFDKVMIYQFDKDWNGDVIAEAKEEEMDSYLGLKFPASDIPRQARELYKKTPYRLIPAVDYEAVKLYPVLNPKSNGFTNLSDSNLRSVAGVHLEYLRNMKLNASMSTRILKDGELWGLIACHHLTPNYLSYEACSVFELMSNVITTKISAVQAADQLVSSADSQQKLYALVQLIYQQNSPDAYQSLIASLLEADGVAVVLDKAIFTGGKTPSDKEIEDLTFWLGSNETDEIYHQSSLSSVYEPAETYAQQASGLLAIPVERGKGNFILAFRTEAVQKVTWGGNPSEAVQFESDGKKYHPRASFRNWQQTVRNTSMPWKEETLKAATDLKNVLTSYRLNNR